MARSQLEKSRKILAITAVLLLVLFLLPLADSQEKSGQSPDEKNPHSAC